MNLLSRRQTLPLLAAVPLAGAGKPDIVDTHIHLFDPARFPYHRNAAYRPAPATLDDYKRFVTASGIAHAVVVHPEPYQDDHAYLKYCLQNEPSPGFFKGTCLFDALDDGAPARMRALVKELPRRIVALRIHATEPGRYPAKGGPIRDRDLGAPEMRRLWKAAHDSGIAIQMHMVPRFAPQVRKLAEQHRDMPVIIDHLARAGQGSPAEYDAVLRLAELPEVYMKFSGVRYSSKREHPFPDTKPLIRRTVAAFGPGRMIWGGVGMNMPEHRKNVEMFETLLDFLSEPDRSRIRAGTARKLYSFA